MIRSNPACWAEDPRPTLVTRSLQGTEPLYLDACATTPLAREAIKAMEQAWRQGWANPSSLHSFGLEAAELLERSRFMLATDLGAQAEEVVWCSGGTEAIHMALLGSGESLPPGRLLISTVEHPATNAAATALVRRGWQLETIPVDRQGLLDLEALEAKLAPPTRMVSLIWGQSEVGSLQPVAAVGALCKERGIRFHVDAVQVLGHSKIHWADCPVDLLSGAAHKLQGPRGIGVLLVREGLHLAPLIGGVQERGRRGGTEPVALAAGFAAALRVATARLETHGGEDPLAVHRDALWCALKALPGVELLGPDPGNRAQRLPHHLSLMVRTVKGDPIPGRALVRELARLGVACSSGAACSARKGDSPGQGTMPGASPVLLAMGYSPVEAAAGVRLSLGPWVDPRDLEAVPGLLLQAIRAWDTQELAGAMADGR